jgi:hypothetical protein
MVGVLQFLGHRADQAWAEQIRQSFRHTIMWHLAFWEWVGSVLFFMFMMVTVLLLPEINTVNRVAEAETSQNSNSKWPQS